MTSEPVTYLFVPADRPERHAKALASGADRAIIDLEDAVGADAKPAARAALVAADLDWSRVVVRINDAASAFLAEDLAAVAATPAAAVMVPKAEDPAALAAIRAAIGREVELVPQIETARGLAAAAAILSVPGVRRLAFGHLDFALDIGAAPDWEAMLLARSQIVLASALARAVPPIDSVTPNLSDEAGLLRETGGARRLGFGAKLLIHPRQVAPVAKAFAPSEAELVWARRVVAADAAANGAAVQIDGRMIDRPVVDRARRMLARAGEG